MSTCASHPPPSVSHAIPQSSPAIGTAPTNQFAKYYSEGTYDYCPARFTAWHVCLKTKLSKPERAQEIQQEARQHPHARWHAIHARARMLLPFDSCSLPCAPGVGQDCPTRTPLGVPTRVRGRGLRKVRIAACSTFCAPRVAERCDAVRKWVVGRS